MYYDFMISFTWKSLWRKKQENGKSCVRKMNCLSTEIKKKIIRKRAKMQRAITEIQ